MIVYNDIEDLARIKNAVCDEFFNVRKSIDIVQKNLDLLYLYTSKNEHDKRKQNPYIVKTVIKHMANGMNKHDAIILASEELMIDIKRVESVYWQQNRYMSAINLFAKRYFCEKLKKAGFTAKEIAKLLGISENHVFKLMRSTIDFWFLDDKKNKAGS